MRKLRKDVGIAYECWQDACTTISIDINLPTRQPVVLRSDCVIAQYAEVVRASPCAKSRALNTHTRANQETPIWECKFREHLFGAHTGACFYVTRCIYTPAGAVRSRVFECLCTHRVTVAQYSSCENIDRSGIIGPERFRGSHDSCDHSYPMESATFSRRPPQKTEEETSIMHRERRKIMCSHPMYIHRDR